MLAFLGVAAMARADAAPAALAPTPASLADINAESGEGRLFKGATVPFGMMMWGPNAFGENGPDGYSLTCLSGAEMSGDYYEFVNVRPTVRPIAEVAARHGRNAGVPRAITGEPGYCCSQVPDDVQVELTTTTRAGLGRFTPVAGKPLTVKISATRVHFDPEHQRILGSHRIGKLTVYFAAEFDHAFAGRGVIQRDVPLEAAGPLPEADLSGGYVTFAALPAGGSVRMRLGMSYVSSENALKNLGTELADWDFDKLRAAARQRWNEALGSIEITGGEESRRRLFYTCLYRVFLQPNTFSDADGQYLGFDWRTHQAQDRVQYANYSIWDIYRTWVELVAFLRPREAADMMQSLVEDARECEGAMPRWSVANVETGTMEEGSATPLVCSAYAFGATGFDVQTAFDIMDWTESAPGARCQGTEAHEGLADFLKLGYVPQGFGNLSRSASFTLEYSASAFALAQLAKSLGKTDRFEFHMKNAHNWANLYHAPSGYLHARKRNGSWLIDPDNPAGGKGFTEGNAAQFTWTVRHDMRSVIDRVGGDTAAVERLDALCRELNAGPAKPFLWIGNEPSFNIPWAFDWAGRPDRADAIVHAILTQVWRPGTTPGADDLGAMSAWYVWASMGLYPAIPGVGGWTINGPLFDSATIHAPGGRQIRIGARRSDPAAIYVKSVSLNGNPWSSTWLPKSALDGPTPQLEFTLSAKPDGDWGKHPADRPPSFPSAGGSH
jgi:predicted alpha-1,2-mannosidase